MHRFALTNSASINNKIVITMEVKIKKLNSKAVIPTYAMPGDAGMDLTPVTLHYDDKLGFIYGTGLAIEIPKGYLGFIFPRSSNRKTNAYMCNHVGIIDSGYRGEIFITFKNRDANEIIAPYDVKEGKAIAQLVIMPYPTIELVEVEELSETERGEGGHGHTDNKNG